MAFFYFNCFVAFSISFDIFLALISVDNTIIACLHKCFYHFIMLVMSNINVNLIQEAIYNLCIQANTVYSADLYNRMYDTFLNCIDVTKKNKLLNILKNIELSYKKSRPLCQDTGQVLVFLEIGQDCHIQGANLYSVINSAVSRAYTDNYFRKSVVNNAIFDRVNTNDNTPAIIYTDIIDGDEIKINLLVKGAGSENYSQVTTLSPTSSKTDIFQFIKQTLEDAGDKSCPPYVIGIGAGGTIETSALLSKKSFFNNCLSACESEFINDLKLYLGDLTSEILDIKIKSTSTHIASLPVAVTINCHSTRHASCIIKNDVIMYANELLNFRDLSSFTYELDEIYVSEIDKLRSIPAGKSFLLSGEIFTARDAAHEKLFLNYLKNNKSDLDLKNKIIFYAGPCPPTSSEIIGPIGPTTSARMDKYTDFIYSNGVIATIGKGERSKETIDLIKSYNGRYFVVQGGIACYLSDCVKSSQVIAYDELGTEAIRKLYVEKLPVMVEI